MNKQFSNFLKNKLPLKEENGCDHYANEWCQNCVATPMKVRDPFGGQGFIFSNSKEITEDIVKNCNLTTQLIN